MTAVRILLAFGTAVVVYSVVGVLLARNVYPRLHYTGPAATLGAFAIAAAVVVREGLSQAGIKAVLAALIIAVTNPILAHATARAARIRERGRWEPSPEERV